MPRPSKAPAAEVLAWLRDNPAKRTGDASRHFGVPEGTIRSWQNRERTAAPRGELTVLRTPAAQEPLELEDDPALTEIDLARAAIRPRLVRLGTVPADESTADSARIVASLADRVAVLQGLSPAREVDPSTPEGRAALLVALRAIHPDLLAEALRPADPPAKQTA